MASGGSVASGRSLPCTYLGDRLRHRRARLARPWSYGLIALFAAFALVVGVTTIVGALRVPLPHSTRAWLVFDGLLAIAVGVVVVVWPDLSATQTTRKPCKWRLLNDGAYRDRTGDPADAAGGEGGVATCPSCACLRCTTPRQDGPPPRPGEPACKASASTRRESSLRR
jgi:hypothetical protein